jgi:hypothetical protein
MEKRKTTDPITDDFYEDILKLGENLEIVVSF